MDAIVYDKVGKEAEKVREALYGIYPQETITDAAIASFDDGADGIPVKALTVGIEPVQSGTGDPSPDNVRPISGWTGTEVTRTGKNLFDPQIFADYSGVLQADGSYYFASPNSLYMKHLWDNVNGYDGQLALTWIKKDDTTATNTTAYPVVYYTDGTVESVPVSLSTQGFSTATFVTSANKVVDYITCSYGTNKPGWYKLQIELGSSATAFEEYKGTTISVTFPSSAGTVYGGTLTLNPDRTGTLVVDRITWEMTPDYISGVGVNSVGSGCYVQFRLPTLSKSYYQSEAKIYCNVAYGTNYSSNYDNHVHFSNNAIGQLFFAETYFSNVEEANAWIINNPIYISFIKQSVDTYQLTESEVSGILKTLYGTNNIWADTGNIKKLTYRADLGKYIDSHITTAVANALNA